MNNNIISDKLTIKSKCHSKYNIYVLGYNKMEDSTNDLNQNEDVIPHSGELRQEIAPKTEEVEYKPGLSGECMSIRI